MNENSVDLQGVQAATGDAKSPTRYVILVLVLLIGLLLAVVAGVVIKNPDKTRDKLAQSALGRAIGIGAQPETAAATPPAPVEQAPSGPAAAGLMGRYSGEFSDQRIELAVAGGRPQPLAGSDMTITYANVVNGGTCTAQLKPKAGSISVFQNLVDYEQAPVADKPACPAVLPVRIDISGRDISDAGVVQSLQVEWRDPASGDVVMTGVLKQGAGA